MVPARSLAVLALLTLVAGYADAVAFFGLGVFTANMTGNTVLLAAALAERFLPHAPGNFSVGLTLISLLCFVLGATAAAIRLRDESARPPVRTVGVMAAVTALMVLAAWLYGHGGLAPWCVVVLSTIAGAQAVVAARAGVPGITTVVVTGVLVTAVLDFFGSPRGQDRRRAGMPYALDWAIYFAGAGLGMLGYALLGTGAFWPPAVVVALSLPML